MPTVSKVVGSFVILFLLSPCLAAEEHAVRHVPSNQPEFWERYLYGAFHDLGYSFTIEIKVREPDDPKYESVYIVDDEVVDSVDAVIAKASKNLKDFSFVKNKRNPRIIHVIDNDLRKLPNYPLDQKMSLKFSGIAADLSRSIHKRFPTLVPRTSGDIHKAFDDNVTKIECDAKDEIVRDILTDCVPRKGYCTILWRAETEIFKGKRETFVQYYGPAEGNAAAP
jgi:hypothetical protein